jgi:isoleucyl-tRNA synthetase
LTKILLPVLDASFIEQVEAVKELILSEVNVKTIEYITDTDGFISKKAKANFKTLGKKLGKHMKQGAELIGQMNQDSIRVLETEGQYVMNIGDESFTLTREDIEIHFDEIPGWQVATDKEITVALDVQLTDSLVAEGIARELVNRIQNIRKTKDFNVTDRIHILMQKHDIILPALESFSDYIKNEVLALSIDLAEEVDGDNVEVVDGVFIDIAVSRD